MTMLSAVAVASANLLTNGSFETGNFVPNGDNTMLLSNGATNIAGWVVAGDSIAWIGPTNPFGLLASDGDYFLDLTDYPVGGPYGGIGQTFATNSGWTYKVQFDLGTRLTYGGSSSLRVSAAGDTQDYTEAANGDSSPRWDTEQFIFVANSNMATLSFLGIDPSHAYIGLDNVVVEALVPEPGSLAVLGLGAFGLLRRKK